MLKTVRVPPAMEPEFARAEELVARYFKERVESPEQGTIEIFGERYVLVRAASLSVEFFALARELYGSGRATEADKFARNILYDLAHAIGKADAQSFHARMGLRDPLARLSAGPVIFAHAGWASVEIAPESVPLPGESFYLVYDHPYSFEADAWLRARERRDFPVCIMNAGYSAGWCEESFGVRLVASEVLCRARGDEACRFVMARPDRIDAAIARYVDKRPGLAVRVRGYQVPDLFARKRMEEELRLARDALEARVAERTAELRRSNERLVQEMAERERVEKRLRQTHKLEAIGRLAGGIAHDFNNLMGVVVGRSSMMQSRLPADHPLQSDLVAILQAGQQAAALTRQLLAFSRAQVLRRERVALNRVASDVGRMLRPLIREDIELVTLLGQGAGYVEADRGQIEQVIMNLVVNARDAMPGGGTITLETRAVDVARGDQSAPADLAAGRYVLLAVTDTGVGMDDETVAQIFDPFFTTKDDGRGTGLGLSTVYGIVKQSGGAVAVASEPGAGSRFTVYLPQADPPEGLDDDEVAAPPGAQGSALRGSETVLLVEDQPALRAAVRDILRAYGYTVLEAATPDDALAVFGEPDGPRVELVLTDVVMPRLGGPELVERLRRRHPSIKALYMSGYTEDAALRRDVLTGASVFLPKPFEPEELARKVRAVLDAE